MKIISLVLTFIAVTSSHAALPKRPLSLTLSGGVSLAAYETGFIYYLTHQLHDNQLSQLRIVTGTSAGSINGVIAIVNACSETTKSPHESLNWRAWMPLGIREISDPQKVTATSLFSKDGVDHYAGLLKKDFMEGLRSDCDVVLGAAVTRKAPLKTEIRPGLTSDRHNEFFLVRIKGQGAGKPPTIENFPLNEAGQNQLFLPFSADPNKNYELLESIFVASAMFPLAFPPQALTYCDLESTAKRDACTVNRTRTSDFVDGGIFNNTPIALASTIAEHLMPPKERKELVYGVITLDGSTHPLPALEDKEPSFIPYALNLVGQSTETARNRSVSEIYVNKNGILNQTISNDKLLPRSSQYFVAFTGFLDRGFREYDFYLGMYEARHFFDRLLENAPNLETKRYLASKIIAEYQNVAKPEWQPYFCFLETYEKDSQARGACASSKKLGNFPVLMKINAEIVKNRCDASKDQSFRSCALTKGMTTKAKFEDDESDQKYFYRRLHELDYPFELKTSRVSTGEDILRAYVEPLFRAMVKKQPKEQRFVLREASSILLNSIDFKPQNVRTRFGVGSHFQGSRGYRLNNGPGRPWYFAEFGLMLRGVDTYVNSNPDALALGPFIGIETNWTAKQSFWLEPEVGIRGGYNHSIKEDRSVCEDKNSFQAPLYCRSSFLQPHVSVSILGKVRVEFGSVVYLDKYFKSDFTMLGEIQF